MDYLLDLIMIPIQVIIVFYTIYYFVLAVFGMWRRKEKKNYTPKNSFAIIVCAHNEEAVVGQLVENLKILDYPKDLYDIFVVADNCTDHTEDIARAAGANVHERFNTEEVGKGFAMGWMFDRVFEMDRKYDAFVIFDADNLVHPQFLLEMNDHLEKGEPVIQGYLNAKNPTDTWVAGTFAIAFWMVNHMWHLAKYNLGLSTALGGTGLEAKRLIALVNSLEIMVKNVSFIPELMGMPAANVHVQGLMEENMILLRVKNNLARPYYRLVKRIFDLVVTLCGLVVVLPIGLIIAALIYIDNPGPVLFAHRRVGKHGKEFPCYKFRSMIVGAEDVLKNYLANNPEAREEWERDFKLKDDPRITKIGHFLRKTSLDELPQLLNVLKGEMSLVGPRPIIKKEIEKYGSYINDFFLVPPGITGVWQVSGRSDTTYEERVQMDSWYVHNWSVWIDIVYLVRTVGVVLMRKGAY